MARRMLVARPPTDGRVQHAAPQRLAPCAIVGMVTGARILQDASREFLQAAMTTLLLAVAALTISKAATG